MAYALLREDVLARPTTPRSPVLPRVTTPRVVLPVPAKSKHRAIAEQAAGLHRWRPNMYSERYYLDGPKSSKDCCVCCSPTVATLDCGHPVCLNCAEQLSRPPSCPFCRWLAPAEAMSATAQAFAQTPRSKAQPQQSHEVWQRPVDRDMTDILADLGNLSLVELEAAAIHLKRSGSVTSTNRDEIMSAVTQRCHELVPELTFSGLTQHVKVLSRLVATGILLLDGHVLERTFLNALKMRFGEAEVRSSFRGCTFGALCEASYLYKDLSSAGLMPAHRVRKVKSDDPILAWFTSHALVAAKRLRQTTTMRDPNFKANTQRAAFDNFSTRAQTLASAGSELSAASELQASGLVHVKQVQAELSSIISEHFA